MSVSEIRANELVGLCTKRAPIEQCDTLLGNGTWKGIFREKAKELCSKIVVIFAWAVMGTYGAISCIPILSTVVNLPLALIYYVWEKRTGAYFNKDQRSDSSKCLKLSIPFYGNALLIIGIYLALKN